MAAPIITLKQLKDWRAAGVKSVRITQDPGSVEIEFFAERGPEPDPLAPPEPAENPLVMALRSLPEDVT